MPTISFAFRDDFGNPLPDALELHGPSLEHTIVGGFAEVRLADSGLRHRVLIGRGFLRRFRMLYDGRTGVVTLSDE